MNNNSNNQNNQNNSQQSPKDVKKRQEQEAVNEVGSLAARGAADYFTGGKYEKIRNAPVVGKAAQGLEKTAGKAVGKAANTLTGGQAGKVAKGLKDSGATKIADKSLNAIGGGNPKSGVTNNSDNSANSSLSNSFPKQILPNSNANSSLSNPSTQGIDSKKLNLPSVSKNTQSNQLMQSNNWINSSKNRAASNGVSESNLPKPRKGIELRPRSFNPVDKNFEDDNSDTNADNNSTENQKSDLKQNAEILKKKKDAEEKAKKIKRLKGIASFFIKNPMAMLGVFVLIVLAGVSIYFLFVLVSDMDLVGQRVVEYSEVPPVEGLNLCNEIVLIKEDDRKTGETVSNIDDVDFNETVTLNGVTFDRWEYQNIKIEDYVKGVVQAEAIDVKDIKTFEVAAIASRTYALGIASPLCRIWNNENKNPAYRNPQNYTQDNISKDVTTAVATTSGIIITKDDQLLDMSGGNYYDYFCYKDKTVIDEKNIFRYNMLQENEEERLAIPSDWVKDNVPDGDHNRSGKYGNECQPEGMSLFSAKYLITKHTHEYTTIRTLKYYYGYDTDLRKMQVPIAFGGICDGFDLHKTNLSRDEFIAAVNSYNGGVKYQNLAAIAGQIYDMSILNNFNPELVITRAVLEGYSGGSNNYWGIAAYNGQSGNSFSSLSAGALAYINTMNSYSNANTLYDAFNDYHYSFIGAKWFSPGNSSLGGCYYLPYIEKYYTNQSRLAEAKSSCAAGTQIATNDEDQAAYSAWQVQRMSEVRLKIFNINSDCNDPALGGADVNAILNSNASIGQKAAQLAVAMFDSFGYSQGNRWGSNQADCSSLVYRTYSQLGINFGGNSTSSTELAWCKNNNRMISESQLQPGDLLFKPGHVEIYIGNGQRFGAHTDRVGWDDQVSVKPYTSGYFTEFCRPY